MTVRPHQSLRVHWESPLDIDAVCKHASIDLPLEVVRDQPDIQVMDVRAFSDIDHLMNTYRSSHLPSLIVVGTQEEMMMVLQQADEFDEICYVDDFPSAAVYHLERLIKKKQLGTCSLPTAMKSTDPMTGLPLRKNASPIFDQWLSGADVTHPLATILLDLDHFKKFNDEMGHALGDQMLTAIGEMLNRHTGERIYCSRWGGEEFLILLKADHKEALEFSNFLRKEIKTIDLSSADRPAPSDLQITASFGVATTFGNTDFRKAIEQADANLYQAKRAGRDTVVGSVIDNTNTTSGGQYDDQIIRDFENRIRVTADRLVEYLTIRGRRLAEYYREEANRDGLTGLFNHRYFERRITREIDNAKKDGRPLSLLFLDVDNFGEVNRQYGYPTGDEALRYVVGVLNASVRSVDWTARYGGEEFCVVMPVTPLEEATIVAERIRRHIKAGEVTAYDGRRLTLTVSIGLAQLNMNNGMIDFIQRASSKTREAKRAGKDTIRF